MLLATYALTTLSVEQSGEKSSIDELQRRLRNANSLSQRRALRDPVERLIELAESRHRRRWETCLAPLLRQLCAEARPCLEAYELLTRLGAAMLPALQESLGAAADATSEPFDRMRVQVSGYCQNLSLRLSCEDELVRLARQVLSTDAWTHVGRDFLSQDAERVN